MKKQSITEKIMAMPDNTISDDDHPNKPDISQKEFQAGLKELYEEFKDTKKGEPKNNALADATVDALNK